MGSTSSRLDVLYGAQRPRIMSIPGGLDGAGQEIVELAEMAGLFLDPWQQLVLIESLRERPGDRKWAAFEVGLDVSRQNGKGSILEALELGGLFLLELRLIIHSAHMWDTSGEHFARLEALIDGTPEFSKRVKKVSRTHGSEGIDLYGPKGKRVTGAQRIRFRTRTKAGGRGFTADLVVFDEAMILPEATIGALVPTLSTRPNPQIWYTGSSVDQFVHDQGVVFSRVRSRGVAGDPKLAYFEWSVDCNNPSLLTEEQLLDPQLIAQANPGLGIRIPLEFVENERNAMDPRTFAVERLGVGDWHDVSGEGQVITSEQWGAIVDRDSVAVDPVCFAFDISPNRAWASISVAGKRADGLNHVELIAQREGTGWVAPMVALLAERHHTSAVVYSSASPAKSLVPELADLGVTATALTSGEEAAACGMFFDGVVQRTTRHRGQPELAAAIKSAVKRTLGDAWAWNRKESGADITPVVSSTFALWGASTVHAPEPWVTTW